MKWKQVFNTTGPIPKARHGHKAVAVKDCMIVFGGGNEGILDDLYVYIPTKNQWIIPPIKGDIPQGFAAYGMAINGTKLLVFGGMVKYGQYSNDLLELETSRWEWKFLQPKPSKNGQSPCPRLGHTLTCIGNKAYLFGGLQNVSDDPTNNIPKYLNDLWTIELRAIGKLQWEVPQTYGSCPPPRESHSAVAVLGDDNNSSKIIVFGGMNGQRLNDLWILSINSMTWNNPHVNGIVPLPRSLHSATLIGNKMFVFGGWALHPEHARKSLGLNSHCHCTNDLVFLNIDTLTWLKPSMDGSKSDKPRGRAGHCSVQIHNRLWVWSGRDGYRKAWNSQVCHMDLWYLETAKPNLPSKVQLVRSSTKLLELSWGIIPKEEGYLLQIQKCSMSDDANSNAGKSCAKKATSTEKSEVVETPITPKISDTSIQIVLMPSKDVNTNTSNCDSKIVSTILKDVPR